MMTLGLSCASRMAKTPATMTKDSTVARITAMLDNDVTVSVY
jgi:hypothetical protein